MRASLFAGLVVVCGCEGPSEEPIFPDDFESTYTLVRDCRFSVEHDGTSVMVYANPAAAQRYLDAEFPLPDGAVLVKKEHADGICGEVGGFVAMRKKNGEWRWQRTDVERTVDVEADAARCLNCHERCTEGRDLTCTDP